MNGLRDQGFEAGDEVVFFESSLVVSEGVVSCVSDGKSVYPVAVAVGMKEFCFTKDGRWLLFKEPQRLFHRDAVTIDEHGRLTAINHDYVKPRPKIVTQLDYDFQPFEQVLLRDADDQPWRKDLFDKRTDAHKPYVGLVLGKGWSQCIPFAGNEKLDGVVTP